MDISVRTMFAQLKGKVCTIYPTQLGSYNHCMNFVGRPPGKPGRLSGYKYQEFEMKHQNIYQKKLRLFRMNTTTVITGERANDLASEWYLVSLFLKSPGRR